MAPEALAAVKVPALSAEELLRTLVEPEIAPGTTPCQGAAVFAGFPWKTLA